MSKKQVVKMRQKRHVFFGVIIFLMVLTYLTYHAVAFLNRQKPTVYTIGEETSLVRSHTYTGLIIRQEQVVKTPSAGIINYYIPASGRVSVNDTVYSLDESGNYSRVVTEEGIQNVHNTDVSEFLNDFAADYSGRGFSAVYDLKYELNSRLILSASASELDHYADGLIDGFYLFKAPSTGLVEYYTDGYEEFDEAQISAEDFDRSGYEKKQMKAMEMAEIGTPAYKIITSEAWSIYIPLSNSEAADLAETKSLKVRFTEADLETTVRFELVPGTDGTYYGKLTLTKYMLRYADTRFLKVELLQNNKSGLLVPKSAAAQEEFYVIPADYLTTGGNSAANGFQTRDPSDPKALAKFVPVNVIYNDGALCYVEQSELEQGTVLIKPNSTDTISVVKTEKLTGAYQVNRGYALFRVFEILEESEDYYVVKNGSYGGLSAFDKILLYPVSGMNGSFIY